MSLFNQKLNKTDAKQKDSLINPEVLEVNLIKDEIGVEFNWSKHLLSFFLVVFFATLLVTEIYYGLDWWQKQEDQKTVALNMDYEAVNNQVRNINAKSNDFFVFKDKLILTKKMADNHIYFTNFFDWLEKNTLNTISYNGFSGDVSGKYTLAANAKTFSDISWQTKNFRDNKFTDSVRVDSGSAGKEVDSEAGKVDQPITFSLELKVKPGIFLRQPE